MKRVAVLFLFLVSLTSMSCDGHPTVDAAPQSDAPKVKLELYRQFYYIGAARPLDVLVNDEKVGTITSGQSLAVSFVPQPGEQVLQVVDPGYSGAFRTASKHVQFKIVPGGRYYFTCAAKTEISFDPNKAANNTATIELERE